MWNAHRSNSVSRVDCDDSAARTHVQYKYLYVWFVIWVILLLLCVPSEEISSSNRFVWVFIFRLACTSRRLKKYYGYSSLLGECYFFFFSRCGKRRARVWTDVGPIKRRFSYNFLFSLSLSLVLFVSTWLSIIIVSHWARQFSRSTFFIMSQSRYPYVRLKTIIVIDFVSGIRIK